MADERALRPELRRTLDEARAMVRTFSGLYRNEDMLADVLRLCDEVGRGLAGRAELDGARRLVALRCGRLVQVTDRFSERDPLVIATARAEAIAALDAYQDTILGLRTRTDSRPDPSAYLKRPSD